MPTPPTTLAEFPYVVVRVSCSLCERRGVYRLARLAARFGSEITLEMLLRELSKDCRWHGRRHHPYKPGCGANFIDLNHRPGPPDTPPGMAPFAVIPGGKQPKSG